jgi:hypothetical protein
MCLKISTLLMLWARIASADVDRFPTLGRTRITFKNKMDHAVREFVGQEKPNKRSEVNGKTDLSSWLDLAYTPHILSLRSILPTSDGH